MPLTRRFHVGDLLAVVTGEEGLSPRGVPGAQALIAHMTRYAPFAFDDGDRLHDALRAAVLGAYPELGAYTEADLPPPECLPAWRRRAQEFGRYLVAPVLPPTHPLLTDPAARPFEPFALRRAEEERADTAGGATESAAERTAPRAAEPSTAVAGPTGSRLHRRFHVGDLLAITTRRPEIARRGASSVMALVRYMVDRPLDDDATHGRGEEFRAVLLAAYPELGTFTEADVPPPELLPLWMRRREREFGRYLVAPQLPASHPLRATPRPRTGDVTGRVSGPARAAS